MEPEIIVVGAGVVGSALGYALGQQGRRVTIIERDLNEPDRIVGELLQPGGVGYLRELGLEACLQGIDAQDAVGYTIFFGGKEVRLPYPKDKRGVFLRGSSFHHGAFIMSLRRAAGGCNNVTMVQGTVKSLIETGGVIEGVVYKNDSNELVSLKAPLTILCDGCNSNFRDQFINEKPHSTTSFVGVVIKDATLPYPNHGHVFITPKGPALAYQIGTHETRLLIDIPNPLPSANNGDLQNYLKNTTAPLLPESIRGAFLEAVQTTQPRSMPSKGLNPHNAVRPGVLLIGDAFNMRHPLTGGGMTVGFADAVVVRDLLATEKDLNNKTQVCKKLQQLYVKRKGYSSTINVLSWALYHVFSASNDPILPEMRKACVDYLGLGGFCTNGPVSLLAGVKPHPSYLMLHFFAVAFYGVYRMLWPFPTPRRILNSFRLLSAASNIVVPLVKGERILPFLPILCRMLLLTRGAKPTTPAKIQA